MQICLFIFLCFFLHRYYCFQYGRLKPLTSFLQNGETRKTEVILHALISTDDNKNDGKNSKNKNQLSFQDRLPIHFRLPTRNYTLATEFFQNTDHLLYSILSPSQVTIVRPNYLYRVRFITIPLPPGLTDGNAVVPELEMTFESQWNGNRTIMQTRSWVLLLQRSGNTPPRVIESVNKNNFNISLSGEIIVEDPIWSESKIVMISGYVDYAFSGMKPSILKNMPTFVTDGIIQFVQYFMKDFVTKAFSVNLLNSFKQSCQQQQQQLPPQGKR